MRSLKYIAYRCYRRMPETYRTRLHPLARRGATGLALATLLASGGCDGLDDLGRSAEARAHRVVLAQYGLKAARFGPSASADARNVVHLPPTRLSTVASPPVICSASMRYSRETNPGAMLP